MTQETMSERVTRLEEWREYVDRQMILLTEINEKLSKQAGFFAGIAFCVAGFWALVALVINALVRYHGTH